MISVCLHKIRAPRSMGYSKQNLRKLIQLSKFNWDGPFFGLLLCEYLLANSLIIRGKRIAEITRKDDILTRNSAKGHLSGLGNVWSLYKFKSEVVTELRLVIITFMGERLSLRFVGFRNWTNAQHVFSQRRVSRWLLLDGGFIILKSYEK